MKQCSKCGGYRNSGLSKKHQCTCEFKVYKPEITEMSYKDFMWSINQIPEEIRSEMFMPSEEEYNAMVKEKGRMLNWQDLLKEMDPMMTRIKRKGEE